MFPYGSCMWKTSVLVKASLAAVTDHKMIEASVLPGIKSPQEEKMITHTKDDFLWFWN